MTKVQEGKNRNNLGSVRAITASTNAGTVATLPTTVNVTLADGTTKAANITWSAAATSAATYATAGTVTVTGTLADYNNYAVSATVTVNGALSVQSVSVPNATTLTVKFNKAVNVGTATNPANYSIDKVALSSLGTPVTSSNITLSSDKTTVTIDLGVANKLTNKSTYLVGVSKVVTDANSTAMTADYVQSYTFNDTTVPTLGAVSYANNNTAKVSFSEPMTSIATTQVKVFDDQGVDVTNSTAGSSALGLTSATTAGDTDLNIDLTGATVNKTYTVYVYGATDLAGNLAGTKTFTVTKTNSDTTAPTVTGITATALNTLEITYSEPVLNDSTDGYGMLNINGGTAIKLDPADTTNFTSITLDTTKTKLTVVLKTGNALIPVSGGLYTVNVNTFKDLSGNEQTTAYNKVVDFEADTTAPAVVSTTVQNIAGTDCLLVKFDDANLASGTLSGNDAITAAKYVSNNVEYTLSGSTTPAVPFGTASLYDPDGDGKTDTVKVTLPTNLPSGSYTATLAASTAKDATGNATVATPITFNYAPSTTTVKPAVLDNDTDVTNGIGGGNFTQSANDVTIKFTKDVTAATALNVNNYLIDGQVVFSKAIFVGDNKTVKLTLNQDGIKATAARSFTIQNVADADGNVMDPVTFNQTFTENVAPTVKSAALTASDTITLTFSEAIESSTASTGKVDNNDFDIYIDGIKVDQSAVTNSITDSTTGTSMTLKLATVLTASDLSKTITIKPSSANDVIDANGNVLASDTVTVSK